MRWTLKNTALIQPSFLWAVLGLALVGFIGTVSLFWLTRSQFSIQTNGGALASPELYGAVPDFSLIERSGQRVALTDLRDKVWIVDFIYTRCTEACPLETAKMAQLQSDLADQPEVRLVSITIDPENDTPQGLSEFAARFGSDPNRWLFLTGTGDVIRRLAIGGFHLNVFGNPLEEVQIHPDGTKHILSTPIGRAIVHGSQFVLVDDEARIRAYYDSTDEDALRQLRRDVRTLLLAKKTVLPIASLPSVNAGLNATSALLLCLGYVLIRQRKINAHKITMLATFSASTLFLLSYVTYHYYAGWTSFEGQGWIRPVYFAILIPHILLAAAIVPMALVVLLRGLNRRDLKHKRLARWTMPLWLYTSVTGVIVYFMLYRWT